jgi:hypothetical protein
MSSNWAALIVAHLRESKLAGEPDHAVAWAAAVRAYPPRGRDLYGEGPISLFDPPTETTVEFTRRVTADAWYGRNPKLRYFQPEALGELRSREAMRAPQPA